MGQEEHWLLAAPVHSRQFPWQLSQVFVPVFANLFEGQVGIQVVPSRYSDPVHETQVVLDGPVHVSHSVWQLSQVFVPVFPYCPAGQVVRQKFNSKNRTPVQVRHWLFPAPVHVSHSPWQGSHVFVDVFSNTFVATHAERQEADSKNFPLGQEAH